MQMGTSTTTEVALIGMRTMRLRDTTWVSRIMAKISTKLSRIFRGTSRLQRGFKKRSKKKSRVHGTLNSKIIGAIWWLQTRT